MASYSMEVDAGDSFECFVFDADPIPSDLCVADFQSFARRIASVGAAAWNAAFPSRPRLFADSRRILSMLPVYEDAPHILMVGVGGCS